MLPYSYPAFKGSPHWQTIERMPPLGLHMVGFAAPGVVAQNEVAIAYHIGEWNWFYDTECEFPLPWRPNWICEAPFYPPFPPPRV